MRIFAKNKAKETISDLNKKKHVLFFCFKYTRIIDLKTVFIVYMKLRNNIIVHCC